MNDVVTGISSMATRQLLADCAASFERISGERVDITSMGGVDAARKLRAGEPTDLVVLASTVMEQLEAEGHLVPGTRTDFVRSGVSVAVRSGAPHPDISSEESVKRAILAAGTICYSSGPSGNHLKRLFERWGISDVLAGRTIEAPPGIPVGPFVARGEADLGFQQLSELLSVPGIDILGPLPTAIQTMTVFTAGISPLAAHPIPARAFLHHLTSPETTAAKHANGMEDIH